MPGASKNGRLYFERQFLTPPEVARQLGISRSQVYALMQEGIIPYEMFGRGCKRIPTLFVGMIVAEAEKKAMKKAIEVLKLAADELA